MGRRFALAIRTRLAMPYCRRCGLALFAHHTEPRERIKKPHIDEALFTESNASPLRSTRQKGKQEEKASAFSFAQKRNPDESNPSGLTAG